MFLLTLKNTTKDCAIFKNFTHKNAALLSDELYYSDIFQTWPFNFQQNAQGSWSSECVSPERSNSPRIPPHTTGDSHHIASNNQSTQEEYYSPNNFYPRPENRFHNQQNNDYYDQIHRGSNGNSYGMVYND